MRITFKHNLTSFEQLFEEFLTSCKAKGLTDKTISSYASHMKRMGQFLDLSRPISSIQMNELEGMIAAMREKGLGANTIKSYVRVLSAFLTWCKNNGYTKLSAPHYKGEDVVKETYLHKNVLNHEFACLP